MTVVVRQQREHDWQRKRIVPHPARDLFPVAVSDNGECGFWHTDPANTPDAWTLTIKEARGPQCFTFDGSLTVFLVAVLSGRLHDPLFPDSVLLEGATFTPSPPVGPARVPPASPHAPAGRWTPIRAWARDHGYDVSVRGRIPAAIITAWRAAGSA
ncbi:histone-like nucleoid-structuring protein Lsr2 [Streptomyces sp. NPDC058695]|uniref:Lsr2 family DNA-binding protein n=1 Tax=Streptomyces sp. NPDC058695 TaxID=3346604 RepID=UPI00364DC733